MKSHTKILTAAVVLAFMMTCVVVTDVSDSSYGMPTDHDVAISNTLHFTNQTTGESSADAINTAAGTNVCKYEEDCLTFTNDVRVNMSGSTSLEGVLVFDGSSTQTIKVESGVQASIVYTSKSGTPDLDRIGTVIKKGSGDLKFEGDGQLYVYTMVEHTYAIVSYNDMYFEGRTSIMPQVNAYGGVYCNNLYCEDDSITMIAGTGNGIEMKGTELVIDDCILDITSSNYGIKCDNLTSMTVNKGTGEIVGRNNLAFSKNPSDCDVSNTSLYGSNSSDLNDKGDSIEPKDIGSFKHVTMEAKKGSSGPDTGTTILIIVGVLIGVAVLIAVIVLIVKKVRGY